MPVLTTPLPACFSTESPSFFSSVLGDVMYCTSTWGGWKGRRGRQGVARCERCYYNRFPVRMHMMQSLSWGPLTSQRARWVSPPLVTGMFLCNVTTYNKTHCLHGMTSIDKSSSTFLHYLDTCRSMMMMELHSKCTHVAL